MTELRVLVTGADGFVGRYVTEALDAAQHKTLRGTRKGSARGFQTGSIDDNSDWSGRLAGIDVIIHLAARVHIMRETDADPLAAFRAVNTAGTLKLARSAAQQGVRRFIYVSTIGVNGQVTPADKPFDESSGVHPENPYAQSKWEAEQGLWALQEETGLEVVIVRPPLVYGPDAPGNFASLIRLVSRGIPLPLGRIRNLRSLIFVRNLADFLVECVTDQAAKGQLFVIGDGGDVSTSEILQLIGQGFGREPMLLPIPSIIMRAPLTLLRRRRMVDQLWGSLRIDSSKARRLLNWKPPYSTQEGLRWTAQQYRAKGE